jgi:hypothetical protein
MEGARLRHQALRQVTQFRLAAQSTGTYSQWEKKDWFFCSPWCYRASFRLLVLSHIHPAIGEGEEGQAQFCVHRCADEAQAIAAGDAGETVEAVNDFVVES